MTRLEALLGALSLIGATGLVAGAAIEARLSPPVGAFVIERIACGPVTCQLWGSMDKVRSDCCPLQVSAWARRDRPGRQELLFLATPERPTERAAWHCRPEGVTEWGPWLFVRPAAAIGSTVDVEVIHDCHPLWVVRTTLWSGPTETFWPAFAAPVEQPGA